MSGYGGPVLLDMSAWARILLDRLEPADRMRFEAAVRAEEVFTCEAFLLEALYSARGLDDHRRLTKSLDALPRVATPPTLLGLAREAQAELAETPGVSHRVKPVDLLVSATAHDHGLGVLHYDHDYDVIAESAGLRFRSVWVAPRGSID